MNKIKVFIPVEVEKELPKGGIQRVLYNDGAKTAYYNPKGDKGETWSDDAEGRSLTFPEIWLKEQEGYFFTEIQLEKFKKELVEDDDGFMICPNCGRIKIPE